MKIEIKLFASLRKHLSEGDPAAAVQLDVSADTTVAQVLARLKVPADSVRLIFVNNVRAELDQLLQAGDRVGVFPPVAGG